MKLHGLLTIAVIFIAPGCEISTDWKISPDTDARPVVEAILTNELQTQEIRLTRTFEELNITPPVISDAVVTVHAGSTVYLFDHDPSNPGNYRSREPFAVVSQLQYELIIELDGSTYTASAALSEVAPIPSLVFERVDTSGNFTLGNRIVPVFQEGQQAMYRFDLDWSHLQSEGQNKARVYYYTFSSIHVSEALPPERQDVIFPAGTIAQVTKYGLSPGYAAYLQAVTIETTWNGNWFYGNPENSPTNLNGGAIGYFATCAVLRETVIVQ